MKQKAAVCISIVALAVTGYLCMKPNAEKNQTPDTSIAASDQRSEPTEAVNPDENKLRYLVDIEKAKQLLQRETFLYPTDQMFRLFEHEAEPLR
jgi:hypothetical protein